MVDSEERMIKLDVVCIGLFQILFLISVFFFGELYLVGRNITYEEWVWAIENLKDPYDIDIFFICTVAWFFISVIDVIAICLLLTIKRKEMPIRTRWKIAIPLVAVFLYLPVHYYLHVQAKFYRFYIDFVPAELFLLASLGLILLGYHGKREMKQKIVKNKFIN